MEAPWLRSKLPALLAFLFASLHLLIVVHGAVGDSQTVDEGVHLAAGVSYWRTGDFRMNPEHPPLWKAIAALPVLPARPDVPTDHPSWETHDEWAFGSIFMHENRTPTIRLLLLGRLPTFLAGAALVLVIFSLGRRLFSTTAGLAAAWLTAFDPNLIAHARYITTDLPLTLMVLVTIAQLWRYVHAPTRRNALWLALAFVAALLVKFSALYLFLAVPLTFAVARRHLRTPWSVRRLVSLLVFASVLGISAAYGFQVGRIGDDPRVDEVLEQRQAILDAGRLDAQPGLVAWLVRATDEGDPLRVAIDWLRRAPVPSYWYLRGVSSVVSRAYWGSYTFLFGRLSDRGFPWYFPAVFILKTPLPTLILTIVAFGAILAARRRSRLPLPYWFLIVPAGLYAAITLFSRLNLGVRHLLPIYPFLFLGIGSLWSLPILRRSRLRHLSFLLVLALLPLATARVHPSEIAYFSEAFGGTQQGHRFLSDSNLDWGQDLLRLGAVMRRRDLETIPLAYSGTADPERYGVHALPLTEDVRPDHGLVAISVGHLVGDPERYAWLRGRPVVERAGASILIIRID